MILRNRMKDARAMKLMGFGMTFLVVGLMLPLALHPSSNVGQNLLHGVSGMLLGLSISLNLLSVRLARRQRRCAGS